LVKVFSVNDGTSGGCGSCIFGWFCLDMTNTITPMQTKIMVAANNKTKNVDNIVTV
jgi:hypothetical protein